MSIEESIYGAEELAAIEAWSPQRPAPGGSGGPGGVGGVAGLRRTSVGGALAAAILLGLRDVLEPPPDDDQAVVVDAPGEPEDRSAPVALRFDAESPGDTVAVLRR